MRVSREQVAENRRTILDAACRLFRTHGFDAVTVADVMKAAGLTHGGFYGYFKSKDDLIAQTLTHALAKGASADADLVRYAAAYLSPAHRDNVAAGCAIAALGAEAVRQPPEARAAMAAGLREQIDRFAANAPHLDAAVARRTSIGSLAAMIGGVILARLAQDPKLSDEVLEETKAWILENAQRSQG
jgi:TetR/AcrR family transcriptional regulator, transcriptional repressor for nem operon